MENIYIYKSFSFAVFIGICQSTDLKEVTKLIIENFKSIIEL